MTLDFVRSLRNELEKGDAHITTVFAPMQAEIKVHDLMAPLANHPNLTSEGKLFLAWVKNTEIVHADGKVGCDTASWMWHFEFVGAKKKDAYLLRFAILPNHVLSNLCHLFVFFLRALGGQFLDGAAPKGPLFHSGAKNKR